MPTRLLSSSITQSRCFRSLVNISAASFMLVFIWIVRASSVVSSPTVLATILRALRAISCCVSGSSRSNGRIVPDSSFWMKSKAVTQPTKLFVIGSRTGAPLNPAARRATIASSTVSVVFNVFGFGVCKRMRVGLDFEKSYNRSESNYLYCDTSTSNTILPYNLERGDHSSLLVFRRRLANGSRSHSNMKCRGKI